MMAEQKAWKYCVVGNIVRERIDENGTLRHGKAIDASQDFLRRFAE